MAESSLSKMFNPIGAATSVVGGLFNIFSGAKMMREAKNIKPDYYSFNDARLSGMESQYARDMLGRAQMQVNARTPGAAARERQLQTSMAGTQAAISRGAVDPTMAMQSILASQAQTNDQVNNQLAQEAQFQQQREANLMNAQGTMISERDKALAERMNKFQMDMSQKNALRSAGQSAISSGISGIAGTMTGLGAQAQQTSANNEYMSMLKNIYGGSSQPTAGAAQSAVPFFNSALSQRFGSQGMQNNSYFSRNFKGKLGF